jgi:hypothetical protein
LNYLLIKHKFALQVTVSNFSQSLCYLCKDSLLSLNYCLCFVRNSET